MAFRRVPIVPFVRAVIGDVRSQNAVRKAVYITRYTDVTCTDAIVIGLRVAIGIVQRRSNQRSA